MKRFKEKEIQEWINRGKGALLLDGARQVGKTYLVRKMLECNKIPFLEINFVLQREMLSLFREAKSGKELLDKLRLYSEQPLLPGQSVIFLDEIQEYPEIVSRIKGLVDEGGFRYVLSGSLLGVTIKGIHSFPVGYVTILHLYPFSFFEFCLAVGVQEKTIEYLKERFKEETPVDKEIHRRMNGLLKDYLVVGGMPYVVDEFVKTRDLSIVKREQTSIINQYKADFIRYETVEKKLKIIAIYDNMPSQLNKRGLRFRFTYLNKELKFDRYENSFLWLAEAGVALPVYDVDEPLPPLSNSKEKNQFKLFFSDVGLLSSYYPNSVLKSLITGENTTEYNLGGIHENFVAQEIISMGLKPYYFSSHQIGEIDFLLEQSDGILPIEVKSGHSAFNHKSIDKFLASSYVNERKRKGIVLSYENVMRMDDVLYLPLYMTSFIGEEEEEIGVVDLDLDGL